MQDVKKRVDEFLRVSETKYAYATFTDVDSVTQKLTALFHGGPGQIHVISDFDMTLTKHWIPSEQSSDGRQRNLSSHGVLERGPAVSKAFANHTAQLAAKYYPMEIDSSIPIERKTGLMIEWWNGAHQAMIQEGITREQIRRQAEYAQMTFRHGLLEFLDETSHREIPLLVFSAGIADVVEALLSVSNLTRDNQHVLSNRMIFDDAGKLSHFREPLIHTLNKGEQAVTANLHHRPDSDSTRESTAILDALERRRNVILLGDSVGDAHMSDGVAHNSVLKIGFLNFGDHSREEEFRQAFDIIIHGDESLDFVTALLRAA